MLTLWLDKIMEFYWNFGEWGFCLEQEETEVQAAYTVIVCLMCLIPCLLMQNTVYSRLVPLSEGLTFIHEV